MKCLERGTGKRDLDVRDTLAFSHKSMSYLLSTGGGQRRRKPDFVKVSPFSPLALA